MLDNNIQQNLRCSQECKLSLILGAKNSDYFPVNEEKKSVIRTARPAKKVVSFQNLNPTEISYR